MSFQLQRVYNYPRIMLRADNFRQWKFWIELNLGLENKLVNIQTDRETAEAMAMAAARDDVGLLNANMKKLKQERESTVLFILDHIEEREWTEFDFAEGDPYKLWKSIVEARGSVEGEAREGSGSQCPIRSSAE
ncbi:hypothetical protein ABW21_db0208534 [Orbilia brochopaga]|nr:hypothetical protein ABW21_db0208534 [Drechslerella brochopaga]